MLLLTSLTHNQFIFYNDRTNRVFYSDFYYDIQSSLQAFNTVSNVYQLKGRTYVLPALSQDIFDITDINPVFHFNWCFGTNDNSEKQIRRLTNEINIIKGRDAFKYEHEAVGNGKILNHHFIRVFETSRFNIAILEYNNDYKHVIIDKTKNQSYTFNNFREGVVL